jgi:hypothetical protein
MGEYLDIDVDALFADMFTPEGEPVTIVVAETHDTKVTEDADTLECDYVDLELGVARVLPRPPQ